MNFTSAQVEPAPGKFFIRLTPISETTEGGLHLPKMVDAQGRPTTSMPQTATATIVASGGPQPGGAEPKWQVGDVVILSVVPPTVEFDGGEYGFIDFYQAIARIN